MNMPRCVTLLRQPLPSKTPDQALYYSLHAILPYEVLESRRRGDWYVDSPIWGRFRGEDCGELI